MNFPVVFKGILVMLIQQAESELGGGKGAEKKKWVIDHLRKALIDAKWSSLLVEVVVSVASILVDFLLKEALELLGK